MASNNYYNVFCCALAEDHHFLQKSITLSCGHSICQKCIPIEGDLVCKQCNEQNVFDLTSAKENYVIKTLFELHYPDLFESMRVRFYDSLKSLKGKLKLRKHLRFYFKNSNFR
jgi:hypothetical protein